MNKFTHTVTFQQWHKASNNWHRIMNRAHDQQGFAYFDVFLGHGEYRRVLFDQESKAYVKCTERAYNKIEMLNSPHARTLLKAFKAKYGYHKDIP